MESSSRSKLALLGGILIALVAVGLLMNRSSGQRPPPNGGGTYYTGPKKNKSGQDVFSNEENQISKPVTPPGAENKPAGNTPTGGKTED